MKRIISFSLILTIVIFTIVPTVTNGADILFFMGMASHSHRVALQTLAVGLAETGHNITFLSFMKSENPHPKIKEFYPEEARIAMTQQVDDIGVDTIRGRLKQKYYDPFRSPQFAWETMLSAHKITYLNDEFKEWLQNSHFDLIIYDSPLKELANGVAYKMKAKVIAYVTPATPWMYDFEMFGLPAESSWLPDWSHGSEYPLIPHHFMYAYNVLWWYFSYKWYYLPKIDEILTELYGEGVPPVEELIRQTDLVFLNEHFSAVFPRSLPPFMVPVGGMFCKESKGILPKEMETFLQTKDKFMFLSFGSAVKVSALPHETQQMLFEAVDSITDTNFLWKWEGEIPKNLPKNVFAKNWFPQTDVLAHPKCKGFLTQGGAISFQQAAFQGVPMIVVPMWGDQSYVASSVLYHENGIHLELADMNKETLTKAFNEILNNEKYLKNALEVSRNFKDRPMSPLKTAMWWTQYVLRHDTAHLKSPGIQQYWWQRRLLDFWVAVFLFICFIAFVTVKLILVLLKQLKYFLISKSKAEKAKQT